nr:GNAT family N-acetyltransferase [Mycobacteroides abscessus]
MALSITPADFQDIGLLRFLQAHLDDIAPTTPTESRHALDASGLQHPGVRVWVARDGSDLVGIVALARISAQHEELKSMRTAPQRRGQGIASQLLLHALDDAKRRDVTRISLETGSMEFSHLPGRSTENMDSPNAAPSALTARTPTAPS